MKRNNYQNGLERLGKIRPVSNALHSAASEFAHRMAAFHALR